MNNPIRIKFETDIRRLLEDYQFTSFSGHPYYTGKARESLLSSFLSNYLPEDFSIANNCFLIDSYGNFSNECDIIIYSKKAIKQILTNLEYIPIESVFFVIEVKTISTPEEIRKSLESAQKIKSLKKSKATKNNHKITFCYFAYNSKSERIKSDFQKLIELSGGFSPFCPIDVLCIANKGYYYLSLENHHDYGLLNYAWSMVEAEIAFNIKIFFIGILNSINQDFQIGYYATEYGRFNFIYYNDIFNKIEIKEDRIEAFNSIQIASENGDHLKCIKIFEENFSDEEIKRILPPLIKNFYSFNLQNSAIYCIRYILQKYSTDINYIEKIKKIFNV
ncbi:hypothetical protein JWG41_11285 [Leptospira sp. 201903075]|uniref:DUF6602 domain-containing protein n=1 Tax=Leptospira chreensis TaxID=2810035 RepID=UPI0019663422|nr:DUF6602 domain-containing protein [Leptospira chreensis]MBM9591033.1 hypothetical protein [Leptospira chreensis]